MPHSLKPNIHKRAPLIAFLFILALIALTACTTTPTTSLPTPTDLPQTATPTPNLPTPIPSPTIPSDWQYRWLKKIPCSAPCVEGITPGKTTATEAIEILNQNPLAKNVKNNPNFGRGLNWGRISWDWIIGLPSGGALYFTDSKEIVFNITPDFGIDYSLKVIMQSYGEPTYIIAIARQTISENPKLCQEIRLVYISRGIALLSDCYTKFELNENTRIGKILFIIPTREGYETIDNTTKRHPDWLLPWQGFKGFDYYCRDEFNGKLCRGEMP
jgi:hypothetical protein